MKKEMNKKDNLINIIIYLIILLIIIVGFVGIYQKNLNRIINIIPDFTYSMEINGTREYIHQIDDSEEEKGVFVDESGNIAGEVIDQNNSEVAGYTVETRNIKKNDDSALNSNNYKKVKSILEKRLKNLGVDDFKIRLDNLDGSLTIQMAQNDDTDNNYGMVMTEGKLEIIDSQTRNYIIR